MRTFVVVIGLVVGIGAAVGLGAYLLAATPAPAVHVLPSPSPALSATPVASPQTSPSDAVPSPSSGAPASPSPAASPAPTIAPAASGTAAPPTPAASGSISPFPLVGQPAPALTAPKVGGGKINLAALRGKPVWVVFTGTYCPPCRDAYPLMNGLAARYAGTGLIVVAIHVDEGEQAVASFISALDVVFPVGLDEDGSRARTWDAAVLPIHYFIDAKGVVRDAALGGIGADLMARGLQAILPGVKVTP